MASVTFTINHPETDEEIEIEVEFTVLAAEPDVGLMGWGIEDETILEPHQALNKITDGKFWDNIRELIHDKYDPSEDYDEPDRY